MLRPIDYFRNIKLGGVVLGLVVTFENKVNSEPDLFKWGSKSCWCLTKVFDLRNIFLSYVCTYVETKS